MPDQPSAVRPADRWRKLLQRSAVPQEIIDASPEPDATLEPERFRWNPEEDARQSVRPSRRRALEALPQGGTVLDVGVGGGASSLGLVPKPGLIVGVDPLPGMLESFQASAAEAGVACEAVLGTWPETAELVHPVDVAVCHHAIYRVEELEDFLVAMTAKATRRVVVEISDRSPLAALDPLWTALHGIERPVWSVADEAEAVLRSMGVGVEREDMVLPPRAPEVTPDYVRFCRRRLYAGPERDPEIEAFLRAREPQEHKVIALFWPGMA
ncbi:MAG TPA: class I SAM-dependent methyltransferase [Acidimicrobiales bacterium]|nr:class I SAM-dependent methyltransferase [Acidimicrobiales bacterium]